MAIPESHDIVGRVRLFTSRARKRYRKRNAPMILGFSNTSTIENGFKIGPWVIFNDQTITLKKNPSFLFTRKSPPKQNLFSLLLRRAHMGQQNRYKHIFVCISTLRKENTHRDRTECLTMKPRLASNYVA